ncbi:hypothetical protein [Pelodictyon luteolum]|uniref:O-antigen ligase domain-containing protein n=1 Tax=Chlorobium luteolum (strain DSM 273 / BCRC 81028 / 2530) TaxID=319225 RepID=Q3B349_CHLL3|nr:hypothetical protein [Pelodictyon luteolum]ABB24232.1 hypothetical protein Plut_1373 [Pelodictyon luteolum DSM 273]
MGNPGANILVPLAFFLWPGVVILLYKKLDKRLVPVIAYVAGWMFLPCAEYDIFMLKNTKSTVIGYSLLAATWLFDKEKLLSYRFRSIDIPIILWCTTPFFSSLANGLGIYDGLASTLYTTIKWGIPYFFGRVYFNESDILKTLAITIFIGGIIYIPFSWFELIMSPQLHRLTYGFHQHDFLQTLREDGGYRPMVYMNHGLMTSMWMMLASLLGMWLYITKVLPKKIFFLPSSLLLALLIGTFLMYQSMGAIFYFAMSLLILYIGIKWKNAVLVIVLLVTPYIYIFSRSTGSWDGTNLTNYIAEKISPARAQSLQFRFDNETILIDKALQGSFFGWGGYGRARVFTDSGKDLSTTDGLWVITLGNQGSYGLLWLLFAVQLPTIFFISRKKPVQWESPAYAAPAAMAVFIAFTMVDNLLNAMVNPIYLVFAGGLHGLLLNKTDLSLESSEETELDLFREFDKLTSRFLSDPGNSQSKFIN